LLDIHDYDFPSILRPSIIPAHAFSHRAADVMGTVISEYMLDAKVLEK
jgi:hypothetical protein